MVECRSGMSQVVHTSVTDINVSESFCQHLDMSPPLSFAMCDDRSKHGSPRRTTTGGVVITLWFFNNSGDNSLVTPSS